MKRTVGLKGLCGRVGIAGLLMSVATLAQAQDVSGELVILEWLGGAEGEMWSELTTAFEAAHPEVTVRPVAVTVSGDARGGMRTALFGGEVVDIIINTWPAFRAELADAGIIRPIDTFWDDHGWSDRLGDSWRQLSSHQGETYGVTYTFGNRSGIWYKTEHLERAGLEAPPATWDEFLASFDALRAAGFEAPIAMPGQFWAHGEWFETLLLRTAGVETAARLAAHEIPWTDPAVRGALVKFAEMLEAGCCGTPAQMFANDWDGAADQIFVADNMNYLLIGMWMNGRALNDYGLTEGVDYSYFQFPALGMGHDNTSSVDAKELNITTNGGNPEAAAAFLDFVTTATAAEILARYGLASPSTEADPSMLGPVQQIAVAAASESDVHFVLGDLLPGDLADEYRVQLQRFLQDPSEANIDAVLAAIEARAASLY